MQKSPLKKRKGLAKVSPRQKIELSLRDKVREELFRTCKKKNGQPLCQKCDKPPDWRGLHLIHLKALSLGGETSVKNCRLWCAPCHFGKGLGGHDLNEKITKPKWSRRTNG